MISNCVRSPWTVGDFHLASKTSLFRLIMACYHTVWPKLQSRSYEQEAFSLSKLTREELCYKAMAEHYALESSGRLPDDMPKPPRWPARINRVVSRDDPLS